MHPPTTENDFLSSLHCNRRGAIGSAAGLNGYANSAFVRVELDLVDTMPDKQVEVAATGGRLVIPIAGVGAAVLLIDVGRNPESAVGVSSSSFALDCDTHFSPSFPLHL